MLIHLDDTIKRLLTEKAGLDPKEIEVSFDTPTEEWSSPLTRPTINVYLYDIRENAKLRHGGRLPPRKNEGRREASIAMPPKVIDASYMVTCWTTSTRDQHSLLWLILHTFMSNNPIPIDICRGSIRDMAESGFMPRVSIAQSDGVLRNLSDFWGSLGNHLRPSIPVTISLSLELNREFSAPLVMERAISTKIVIDP